MKKSINTKDIWKIGLFLILTFTIIGMAFYFNSWIKETNELRAEAELRIEKAKKFDILSLNAKREYGTCETILAKNEINPKWEFDHIAYCKGYSRWYNMYN